MSEINKYRNYDDLMQSAQICAATATILRVALGQMCAVNALCESKVFADSRAKKVIPNVHAVLKDLETAYYGFEKKALSMKPKKSCTQ
jgi:hypothetical protein